MRRTMLVTILFLACGVEPYPDEADGAERGRGPTGTVVIDGETQLIYSRVIQNGGCDETCPLIEVELDGEPSRRWAFEGCAAPAGGGDSAGCVTTVSPSGATTFLTIFADGRWHASGAFSAQDDSPDVVCAAQADDIVAPGGDEQWNGVGSGRRDPWLEMEEHDRRELVGTKQGTRATATRETALEPDGSDLECGSPW
jgi:hypothetical protein